MRLSTQDLEVRAGEFSVAGRKDTLKWWVSERLQSQVEDFPLLPPSGRGLRCLLLKKESLSPAEKGAIDTALQEQKNQEWWFSIRGHWQGLETSLVVTAGWEDTPGTKEQRPEMPLHILPYTGQPPTVPFLGPQPPPGPWPGKTGQAAFLQEQCFPQEYDLETGHRKNKE